jgi:hypothetical protein
MALSIEEARAHADRELELRQEIRDFIAMLENKDYRTKIEKEAISAALQAKRAELNDHIASAREA